MNRFAAWLVAHGRPITAVVLAVSAVLGAIGSQLRFDFRTADLLPQGHPFIAVHNRFHKNFSESNVLTVMIEARDGSIFTPEHLATVWDVTNAIDAIPGVNHDQVDSIAQRDTRWVRSLAGGRMEGGPVMLQRPTTEAEARDIERTTLSAGYLLGTLVSLDRSAALVRAGLIESKLDYRRLFDAVNRTVLLYASDRVAIHVSGAPRLNGWILALEWEVAAAFAAAIIVTWMLLWLYFRDWRGALRPTISGGLAAMWGLGVMYLAGFTLNPLMIVVPFLITARAVSHSAQMHDRYYEELVAGRAQSAAVHGAFDELWAPTLAGILTDALGVLAIGLVAIPALRALALAATAWLLSLVVTELLLNPIIYSQLRPPDLARIRAREDDVLTRGCRRMAALVVDPRSRRGLLLATAVACSIAVAFVARIDIGDPSASRILEPRSEYNRAARATDEKFGGTERFMVVVEGAGPRALYQPDVLHTIERFQSTLDRLPIIAGSISLVDLLKAMRERFHESDPKWGVIPSTVQDVASEFFLYWGSVYPSTSARHFTPDFSTAPVTFFCRDHTVAHVRGLVHAAEEFIAANPMQGAHFLLAGGFVGTMAAVYDEILRSDALMTFASFAVILVIVGVTYRSLVAAMLLTLPLVVANLLVNAYMAARGIGLDLDTLPVIAVGVGFGIDYGIYLMSRIREALAGGDTLERAIERAIAGSGRTIAFTALTMTAGVLCFTLTEIRFVSEMAMLLALWMCGSAVTSLLLVPALLLTLRPRFLAR